MKELPIDRCRAITCMLLEYCAYALFFFIPISISITEILIACLLCGFIVKKTLIPDFGFLKSLTTILLCIFLAANAVSCIHSGVYLFKSCNALLIKWLKYAGIFIVLQDVFYQRVSLVCRSVWLALFSAGIIGLDAICQHVFGVEYIYRSTAIIMPNGAPAAVATFNHYNVCGGYLACMIPLAISVFCAFRITRKYAIVSAVLIALLSIALFFTFSRGALVATVVSLACMLFLLNVRRGMAGLIFCVFVVISCWPVLSKWSHSFLLSGGDNLRFVVWQGAWQMICENPLIGKGVGTFMDHFASYVPALTARYAHNCYLQMWAEAGIFALTSFLLFICVLLHDAVKAWNSQRNFYLLGCIGAVIACLVHSFFDNNLYALQLAVLFWALLGAMSAVALSHNTRCQHA